MLPNPRRRFFDDSSQTWDSRVDVPRLRQRLAIDLLSFQIEPTEKVLDVGCGTGNLTAELLALLDDLGQVTAVDLSLRMIQKARAKNPGNRVFWLECDAVSLPLRDGVFDRVFCYSAWPHFPDPEVLARELRRVLKDGRRLHIWHSLSRRVVNEIHASAGPAVKGDVLLPAGELSALLKLNGYEVEVSRDDDTGFLVTAIKSGLSL